MDYGLFRYVPREAKEYIKDIYRSKHPSYNIRSKRKYYNIIVLYVTGKWDVCTSIKHMRLQTMVAASVLRTISSACQNPFITGNIGRGSARGLRPMEIYTENI